MRTRNFRAAPDPTEYRLWAVKYEVEYEPGEWASVWFARELATEEDASAVAAFAAGYLERRRLILHAIRGDVMARRVQVGETWYEAMTPEEFAERMHEADCGCPESGHIAMDRIMVEVSRSLGYGEGCDVFEKATKWYA